jgi:hypothetical protein
MVGNYGTTSSTIYQNTTLSGISLPYTLGGIGVYGIKINQSGVVQWAVRLDSTGFEQALGCCVDTTGSLYICGSYGPSNAAIYNANNLISGLSLPSSSNVSSFLVKYNTSGTAQWANTIRGLGSNIAYNLSSDSNNNIYMTGIYQGSTSPSIFGPNSNTTNLTLPATGSNIGGYVVRYNSSGVPQHAFAISGSSNCASYSVKANSTGSNIVFGGMMTTTSNTVLYDGNINPSSISFPSAITGQAAYIASYTVGAPSTYLTSSATQGQQKYITNIGTSNITISISNSNNNRILQSYTLNPGSNALFNYFNGNWYRFI